MRLTVAAVGRLKDGAERDLVRRYVTRIDAAGRALGVGPSKIVEVTESGLDSAQARRAAEAKALGDKLAAKETHLVVLDDEGQMLDSAGFACLIGDLRQEGVAELAFAIGGPDGHGDALKAQAMRALSLGPLTLPHGLARVILVEQIYRALTILSGHPYHRA